MEQELTVSMIGDSTSEDQLPVQTYEVEKWTDEAGHFRRI